MFRRIDGSVSTGMAGLDAWLTREPPEPPVVGQCACGCEQDIYEGDLVYEANGEYVLTDHWTEYAEDRLGAVKVLAERKGGGTR